MSSLVSTRPHTYHNPVYAGDFPDPFILKDGNTYWAYCTGVWRDGRCFGILRSTDLVMWEEQAGAMEPLAGAYPCYWAPEVTYTNGVFYLYYSVGDEATMEIRVATAMTPAGPFVDSGHRLTPEPFAIDPHVFQDDDGTRYLFYATDFLKHPRIGTGTVCARMLNPFSLADMPRPVTRARYDWQIYDPHRAEKGGVRWHTVEGPFVLHHKGLYYQMFSGGNWQNPSYGVSYAISPAVVLDEEWTQTSDGEGVLPILQTQPDRGVIGPGHNSVVRGPDNRQLYCVYHRWAADGRGRQMAIDPLEWVGTRLTILGPTATPHPAPRRATLRDFSSPADGWTYHGGAWQVQTDYLRQTDPNARASAQYDIASAYFLLEIQLRALSPMASDGAMGLQFGGDNGLTLLLEGTPERCWLTVLYPGTVPSPYPLPDEFDPYAWHDLRLEVNGCLVALTLDGAPVLGETLLGTLTTTLSLVAEKVAAEFRAPTVTLGWEEQWIDGVPLELLGWREINGAHPVPIPSTSPHWSLGDGHLWCHTGHYPGTLVKAAPFPAYEVVVTARFAHPVSYGGYAIYPVWQPDHPGPALTVLAHATGWALWWGEDDNANALPLPPNFDPRHDQQFRFYKTENHLTVQWETMVLVEISNTATDTHIALSGADGTFAFDMVRLTALPI